MNVVRYSSDREEEWNTFLKNAKNTTFLFDRGFMDYHKDRFRDHSLMIYNDKNNLIACFPANEASDRTIWSHQGLTYGGVILEKETKLADVLCIFKKILFHYHENKYGKMVLKQFPKFYNVLPSDEVEYALFHIGAKLYRRDTAIVINRKNRLKIQTRRLRSAKKAVKEAVDIRVENEVNNFYSQILQPNLQARFGVDPVHSLEELELLFKRFPENIVQVSAYKGDKILAGSTLFITDEVVHAQYISASDEGRANGSLDYLFLDLIETHFIDKCIFDFGICNESQGRDINYGLLNWKEGFGGRTYSHDFYEINTAKHVELDRFSEN